MPFLPSLTPPASVTESARWFLFHDDTLLVRLTANGAHIPRQSDVQALTLAPFQPQYLGTLDGTDCYAADVTASAPPLPDNFAWRALRALFELVSEEIFVTAGRAFQIINWERTHRFCGRCGTPTEPLAGERATTCPQCGLTNYPRLSPAIIVAIVKDQHLLLARAARFPSHFYSVLAGFLEPGETFEECVCREVKEEVGIQVKNIRYFGSQSWPFPNSLMVGFTAEYAGGVLVVDQHEILAADWFRADALPEIPSSVSIARRLIDWFVKQQQPQP